MSPNLVILALIGTATVYKQFYPTRFTREVRRNMRRLLKLKSDEEFLKGALGAQADKITNYARMKNRGRKFAMPVGAHGFVYIARASVRKDRIPGGNDVRSWDRTYKKFVERLHKASKDTLFKVGYTQRDPSNRIRELNDDDRNVSGSIYWPYNFELAWSIQTNDCAEVESRAHQHLNRRRIGGELFFTTTQAAIDAIERACSLH